MSTITMTRTGLLHQLAHYYVTKGLGAGDFDAIPYDLNVELRAPICPGGSEQPLRGRESLRTQWFAPMPQLVARTRVIDSFVNEAGTAVTVEFHCTLHQPACTLRIIDRFSVNEEGLIIAQENFFDPTALTHPS